MIFIILFNKQALKAMVDVLDPNVPDPKQEREKEM